MCYFANLFANVFLFLLFCYNFFLLFFFLPWLFDYLAYSLFFDYLFSLLFFSYPAFFLFSDIYFFPAFLFLLLFFSHRITLNTNIIFRIFKFVENFLSFCNFKPGKRGFVCLEVLRADAHMSNAYCISLRIMAKVTVLPAKGWLKSAVIFVSPMLVITTGISPCCVLNIIAAPSSSPFVRLPKALI